MSEYPQTEPSRQPISVWGADTHGAPRPVQANGYGEMKVLTRQSPDDGIPCILSGSTGGAGIPITTGETTIHSTGIEANVIDHVEIWASNYDESLSGSQTLYLNVGGAYPVKVKWDNTEPNRDVKKVLDAYVCGSGAAACVITGVADVDAKFIVVGKVTRRKVR